MTILPVTLCAVAAAALINMWLAMRVGKIRQQARILHGDGGHGPLIRRMRAQLNFVENTPFVLLLIGAIELSGKGGTWLAAVSGVYLLARIAHAIGMDSEELSKWRMIGVMVTMLTLLGLAIYAVLIAGGVL